MAITAAASAIVSINSLSTTTFQNSAEALSVAESGLEDSLIRLLRNPNFSGETLTVGGGTATITVSGSNPVIITSKGTAGQYQRTLQATVTFTSGVMTVSSWKEI